MSPLDVWTALLAILPLTGAVIAFVRPRAGAPVALACAGVLLAAALQVSRAALSQGAWRHDLGGWAAPLGLGWHIDGLSAAMLLLTTAVVGCASVYRWAERIPRAQDEYFWPLWLFLWSSINALLLAADLFNLYVTLELLSLSAVMLIALRGGRALAAAWRYFLAAMLGSAFYLLGVALLYGRYGTLDLTQTAAVLAPNTVSALAAALITLGLLLKAAVFPLHFWLPAAHGRAPPAVSAALSGVVVAAAFYLLVRLWLGPFMPLLPGAPAMALGALGAAAIVWGGVLALLQRRLKMLIAYSTVSQLGYGLLLFPLVSAGALGAQAWRGAVLVVLAHGLAKAGMFLAAGCIAAGRGHDRIARLAGPQSGPPLAWLALALAALSLIGVPPTGGFLGKWWLLQAALAAEAWTWAAIIIGGSALTAVYLLRVLHGPLLADETVERAPSPRRAPSLRGAPSPLPSALGLTAFILALAACALGFVLPAIAGLLSFPGDLA